MKDIKYNIKNTPIPVLIDVSGELIFDVPDDDMKKILGKDEEMVQRYRKDLDDTMDYLVAEGFLEAENNISD